MNNSNPPDMGNPLAESVSNQALTILASDVLAVRIKALLNALASAEWPLLADVKQALETYSELRLIRAIRDSAAPDEPVPPTLKGT